MGDVVLGIKLEMLTSLKRKSRPSKPYGFLVMRKVFRISRNDMEED